MQVVSYFSSHTGHEKSVLVVVGTGSACWAAINAHAHGYNAPGDTTRTIDQRRADAFTDLILRPAGDPAPGPVTGGSPRAAAVVQVTVSLDTLTGADEAPGELHGYGPLTGSAAREVAGWPGVTLRRLVIGPGSGRLLYLDPVRYASKADLVAHAHDPPHGADLRSAGCGRAASGTVEADGGRHPDPYVPTAAQARYVRARDPVCSFPTCNQPAWRCELDHTIEYAIGGATCPCNLRPACKRHHQLKTKKLWQLENHPDGSWTWTSPTRRSYHRPPHDHRTG